MDSIVAYSTHATDFRNTIPLKGDVRQREWHVRYVPATDISGAVVDQLAYPPPTLRLVFRLNWCSAHSAHKQERFGTVPADQRELGNAW